MTPLERLLRLDVVLEQVGREQRTLDMTIWYEERGCGTAACALGWAAFDPVLQAEGLTLSGHFVPQWKRAARGIPAGAMCFGITGDEAWWLFSPNAYLSRLQFSIVPVGAVRARVQDLIVRYGTGLS